MGLIPEHSNVPWRWEPLSPTFHFIWRLAIAVYLSIRRPTCNGILYRVCNHQVQWRLYRISRSRWWVLGQYIKAIADWLALVIPKPYELWSESTQRAILPLYLMFSVAWSLEMWDIWPFLFCHFFWPSPGSRIWKSSASGSSSSMQARRIRTGFEVYTSRHGCWDLFLPFVTCHSSQFLPGRIFSRWASLIILG